MDGSNKERAVSAVRSHESVYHAYKNVEDGSHEKSCGIWDGARPAVSDRVSTSSQIFCCHGLPHLFARRLFLSGGALGHLADSFTTSHGRPSGRRQAQRDTVFDGAPYGRLQGP